MKTKIVKMLPKKTDEIANGGVYLQRVRCGKKNCKCARGETHSAHYFFFRQDRKLIKIYVPKAEVKRVSRLVQKARAEMKSYRSNTLTSSNWLKEMRRTLQDFNLHIQRLKEK